jgi:nicotinamide-nucleotide amidase
MSAAELVRRLTKKHWMMATAESCTGGMVASAITGVAGASAVLDRGFVTYSNEAKVDMLGVSAGLIAADGAVSVGVACAMAEGALRNSHAKIALAITGIAGPGGGSDAKPVGLVHFACATNDKTVHVEKRFGDIGRDGIREAAVATAIQFVIDTL